jgi:sugar/nucleoside kinase (ribokinase family)
VLTSIIGYRRRSLAALSFNSLRKAKIASVRVSTPTCASSHPKSYSLVLTPHPLTVLHKGANFALPDPPTQNDVGRYLTGISHLLLQNEIPWASTLAYLECAHARGIVTVFNPSPMPGDAELHAFPWAALSWLIINEGEAESLLRMIGGNPGNHRVEEGYPVSWPDDNNLRLSFSTLNKLRHSEHLVSTGVVCTLGAAGVLASICGLKEILYFPAASLEGNVRDTTGAGDCFTGYFVAGLMESGNNQPSKNEAVELLRVCVQVCLPASKRTISTQILGGRNVCRKEWREGKHSGAAGRKGPVISKINVRLTPGKMTKRLQCCWECGTAGHILCDMRGIHVAFLNTVVCSERARQCLSRHGIPHMNCAIERT